MKYATLFLVVLVALLLTACSDNASFEPTAPNPPLETAGSGPETTTRPFFGHWTTTFGLSGPGVAGCDGDEGTGIFVINGTGFGTALGANTFVSESESDFVNQCGHSVQTAANGDLLEFDFSGTVDASGFPNISFTGDFEFTGGTGRFEGATGSGTYEGTGNANDGAGEVTNIGTLILPRRTGPPSGQEEGKAFNRPVS